MWQSLRQSILPHIVLRKTSNDLPRIHWELVEIWSTWAINHVDESQRRLLNEILAYGKTLCHNMLPQNGWNVVDISLGNRPRERNVKTFCPKWSNKIPSKPQPN
jgi:hypothetical protein